jgi:hypothetical protein
LAFARRAPGSAEAHQPARGIGTIEVAIVHATSMRVASAPSGAFVVIHL